MIRLSALLREPLVRFFLIGGLIYVLYGLIGNSDEAVTDEIFVSAAQIERMLQTWQKTRMRPPTEGELRALIDDYVREEVYYREAVALGFDQDNPIVRRVLRQKMEFLADAYNADQLPTDEALQAYLVANESLFQSGLDVSFTHVFFSDERGSDNARKAAEQALAILSENDGSKVAVAQVTASGDQFPLQSNNPSFSRRDLVKLFGSRFADQLEIIETGSWQGPVTSGYGEHLVNVSTRTLAETLALAEARDDVTRAWREEQRKINSAEFYQRLRDGYTLTVEASRLLPDMPAQ
jgi:hypothetical protein